MLNKKIVAISGPSGSGKEFFMSYICNHFGQYKFHIQKPTKHLLDNINISIDDLRNYNHINEWIDFQTQLVDIAYKKEVDYLQTNQETISSNLIFIDRCATDVYYYIHTHLQMLPKEYTNNNQLLCDQIQNLYKKAKHYVDDSFYNIILNFEPLTDDNMIQTKYKSKELYKNKYNEYIGITMLNKMLYSDKFLIDVNMNNNESECIRVSNYLINELLFF